MKKILLLTFLFSIVLFAQAQFPLVDIYDIQYVDPQNLANNLDTSSYYGDTVQVEGTVRFDPCDYGLSTSGSRVGTWIENAGGGAWNGVHVLMDAAAIGYAGTLAQFDQDIQFIDNFQVGLKVKCTGIITSFGGTVPVPGNTQVTLIPVASSITGIGTLATPPVVTINQFMISDGLGGQIIQYTTGEQYEGAYVELQNVQVVDVAAGTGSNTGRFFWSVQDQSGNKMQIRDVSGWIRNDTSDNFCTAVGSNTPWQFDAFPYQSATLSFLRGTIVEYCSTTTGTCEFYIAPLDTGDIGDITAAPPIVSNIQLSNAVPTTSQTQTVSATITDIDGTVASATLNYSVGLGNVFFASVTMTQSGSTWSGTIPAIPQDSSYVNFWIKAFDDGGNHSNAPDSLATGSFYWVINSGINSIQDIQYNPTGSGTPFLAGRWITSNMSLTGTVMATTGFYDLGYVTIQDGEGPWHGIFMRGQNLSTLLRGDKINITQAKVFENFGVTFLDSTSYNLVSQGNTLYNPYTALNLDSVRLAVFNQTEPFEGSLTGFNNVFVVSQHPDGTGPFGEWMIDVNTVDSIGLRCDDYSNDIGLDFCADSFSLNQQLDYIYGIMYFSFGNWKLLPRNRDDIDGYNTPIGIDDPTNSLLEVRCYPNPAFNEVYVEFVLKESTSTTLTITDLSGRVINGFTDDFNSGLNKIEINTGDFSSGIYLLQIEGKDLHYSGKISVIK